MKRSISFLLCLVLAFSIGGTAFAAPTASLTTQDIDFYLFSSEMKLPTPLYFKGGQTDIPYIDMETAKEMLIFVNQILGDPNYNITYKVEGQTITFTRENGSSMYLSFEDKEIGWDDYNLFITPSNATQPLDIVIMGRTDSDGNAAMLKRTSSSFSRAGEPIYLSFEDFIIDVFFQNGAGYIPLQTYSDLFLSTLGVNIAYNGKDAFLLPGGDFGDMRELYYSVQPKSRSKALIDFNYEELCLALQFNYGLMEVHDIPSFAKLFAITGMDERLKSPDALTANTALRDIINGFLDDTHTIFTAASPYAGDVEVPFNVEAVSRQRVSDEEARFEAASKVRFPSGIPGYQEVGNTAYVTFQEFTMDHSAEEYEQALKNGTLKEMAASDTVALIMYAHQQVTRAGSPIQNVVLDLSRNIGGAVDAAVFTASWFLGDTALNIEDAVTGARASTHYQADLNADHVFDEKDNVSSLNRYCLISPVSFSCGNLLPSLLKSSREVTILGRPSSGGACSVQFLSNADGTIWRMSSRYRLSNVRNGAFYDIDQGVEPDFIIDKISNYYNRENLTNYINSLF